MVIYFIKNSRDVLLPFPFLVQNDGFISKHLSTSQSGIWSEFHLNASIHHFFSTLNHSLIHAFKYDFRSFGNLPYFCAIYQLSQAITKCGGSNTTILNSLFSNGRELRSATMSGFTLKLGLALHHHFGNILLSTYKTLGSFCWTKTSFISSTYLIYLSYLL